LLPRSRATMLMYRVDEHLGIPTSHSSQTKHENDWTDQWSSHFHTYQETTIVELSENELGYIIQ